MPSPQHTERMIEAGGLGVSNIFDIEAPTAGKGKLRLQAIDNSGAFTVALTHGAQAGNRTFTLPTVGADTEVLVAGATQTISGAKTFSGAAKFTGAVTVSGGAFTVITGATDNIDIKAGATVGSIFLRSDDTVSGIVLSSERIRMPDLYASTGSASTGDLYASGNLVYLKP